MKPTIEVTVSPQGDILIDAVGFKGADCEMATKYLEEALGVAGPKQKKTGVPSARFEQRKPRSSGHDTARPHLHRKR